MKAPLPRKRKPGRHGSPEYPGQLLQLERERKAFDLRKRGLSYIQIGKAMDIDEAVCRHLVKGVIERLQTELAEDAEEVRSMELARLDAQLRRLERLVRSDSEEVRIKAEQTILAVAKRRADILGLDAPTKFEDVSKWSTERLERVLEDAGWVRPKGGDAYGEAETIREGQS